MRISHCPVCGLDTASLLLRAKAAGSAYSGCGNIWAYSCKDNYALITVPAALMDWK